jgi:1,4-dihydroxy-6-naphthoate synthase
MKITIAHSPDSDDAFMFYGFASGAVRTGRFEVEHVLADIETLNRAAFEGKYEVSAISFHAYAYLSDTYLLLPHGASMGDRYGPIVVARRGGLASPKPLHEGGPSSLAGITVAVPGTLTTAYLSLRLFDPSVQTVVMPFDRIQEAVRDGDVAAGLLIHEGQLTYQDDGLSKIVDLGEWWADRTGGLPLPLGGNVIRRDLGSETIATVSRLLHESIQHALSNRPAALDYALQFGRGLERSKADRFVGMYVNELTLGYGERGRQAVQRLLEEGHAAGIIPRRVVVEFAA